MLLNLSGAHGPFFTRNIAIIKDDSGHTGIGEVPGGEMISKTLEEAAELLIGLPIGSYNAILENVAMFTHVGAAAPGRVTALDTH